MGIIRSVSTLSPDLRSFTAVLTTTENTAQRFYRPELDVLRFGAFLLILVHHSFPSPVGISLASNILQTLQLGSALGVPLFFFLSAYLIAELLIREKEKTGTVSLRDFYLRRILRIWPLYFGVIAVTVLISQFTSPMSIQHVTVQGVLAYTFLRGNWWFGTGHEFSYFGTLWSISIEEQFYLLLPLLVRSVSKRAVAYTSVVIWIVAQAFTWYAAQVWGKGSQYLRSNSVIAFQYFALGTLVCLALRHAIPNRTRAERIVLGASGIFLFYWGEWTFRVLATVGRQNPFHVIEEFFINAFGIILIFLALLGVKQNAATGILAYLGRRSYGLYVFHFAVIYATLGIAARLGVHHYLVIVVWSVALPLTIFAAQLSYRYFETPFLVLKERFTVIKSRAL